jgi:hypothetical protein
MPIPTFKYHPDPIATGNVEASDVHCICCGRNRGFIYVGPVYAEEELDERICPWCIADGTAATKYDATFTDEQGIGSYGDGLPVPEHVIQEVARTTPGFSGWQQEQWWSHCGDAGAFLGTAGHEELKALGADAILSIQHSTGLPPGQSWETFFQALDKDGSPTGYIFRCIRCGALGGYQDCD